MGHPVATVAFHMPGMDHPVHVIEYGNELPLSHIISSCRSVGYKWKTASCVEANDYFCALREPICHPGYTWLPDIPSSCFKVINDNIIMPI